MFRQIFVVLNRLRVKAINIQYYSLHYDQKCYGFIIELGLEDTLMLPGVWEAHCLGKTNALQQWKEFSPF